MLLAKTSVVAALAVFILLSFNREVPAGEPTRPAPYARLSDAELDDIIKRGEWPKRVRRGKPSGMAHASGWVPRYAAAMLFKKLLRRNGVTRNVIYRESKKPSKPTAGAIVIDRVRWQGRVRLGKPGDLQKLKRRGLRQLERRVMLKRSTRRPPR